MLWLHYQPIANVVVTCQNDQRVVGAILMARSSGQSLPNPERILPDLAIDEPGPLDPPFKFLQRDELGGEDIAQQDGVGRPLEPHRGLKDVPLVVVIEQQVELPNAALPPHLSISLHLGICYQQDSRLRICLGVRGSQQGPVGFWESRGPTFEPPSAADDPVVVVDR